MVRATDILWIALALAGCSRNTGQPREPTGQVAARVGSQVVTTLEIDNELRLANVPVDRRTDPGVVKQVLDQLVLRKYLVQQALDAKMDQEPHVLLDEMRAREQVLANAFIAREPPGQAFGKPDIERYIAANPAKFAQRQVLTVEQIRFALGSGTNAVLAANKEMKTMDEIDQSLTSNGIQHTRAVANLSESEVPAELAEVLQKRKPNQIFFGHAGPTGMYFKVNDEELHPLEGDAAANLALQALKVDALKARIDAATEAAKRMTKFEGEYAKIMAATAKTTAASTP
jgi:EpsD family peptidyl-prolyl cis-trans isomerase